MYKISQFSKLSGLTTKALRYYDEENMLTPSFRNDDTQYRYYTDEDLKKAQLIKQLRTLNFSIMEIKDAINAIQSAEDLSIILQEKINMIEKNISKERELIQQITSNVTSVSTQQSTDDQIDIVEIEEQFVASIRFTGNYHELDTYVPQLYKAVKQHKDGTHFNLYHDEGYVDEADIELCVPIKKEVWDNTIVCKKLPGIKALRTIHHGSYETLYLAYKALFDYLNQHELTALTPSRERYIKGPGMIFKGNPATYITEILLPFEIIEKE